MTIAINQTILRKHFLCYGFVYPGAANASASLPIAVDQNGILQVGTASSGGNTGALIEVNADDENENVFAPVTAGFNYAWNFVTTGWDRLLSQPSNADGQATNAQGNLVTASQLWGYNGATFDRVRLAIVYKTVAATALGNTAVWTPAAGKKFRLMGYTISVAGTLAATGVNVIKLTDGASGTISQHNATVTITNPTGDTQIGADLGQGFLSVAANNVLQVNLGTAMATGSVAVNAWGTEE